MNIQSFEKVGSDGEIYYDARDVCEKLGYHWHKLVPLIDRAKELLQASDKDADKEITLIASTYSLPRGGQKPTTNYHMTLQGFITLIIALRSDKEDVLSLQNEVARLAAQGLT